MPFANSGDIQLHYEDSGSGTPVVFVHEFGTDCRGWEPQMRYLSRFFRCIAFNARGYPPSSVPEDVSHYSQDIVTDDIAAVLNHLGIERAHVVGLSMGSASTLNFGLRHPALASSIVVCGCGYGSVQEQRPAWLAGNAAMAEALEEKPQETFKRYAMGPARIPFLVKDPRGWAAFEERLCGLSPIGTSRSLQGVQATRPGVYELEDRLKAMEVPTLIVVGDEDDQALEPGLFLKRSIPRSGLCVFPKSGHAVNLEEPDLFNETLLSFFTAVGNDRWGSRDPRSRPAG